MWTARTVHSRVGTEGRRMDVEVGNADDRPAAAMTPAAGADFGATFFLDHVSASVRDFTQQVVAGASSPRERASLRFAAVGTGSGTTPTRCPETLRTTGSATCSRRAAPTACPRRCCWPRCCGPQASLPGWASPTSATTCSPTPCARRHGWHGPVRVRRLLQRPPRRTMVEGDGSLQCRAVRSLRRARCTSTDRTTCSCTPSPPTAPGTWSTCGPTAASTTSRWAGS